MMEADGNGYGFDGKLKWGVVGGKVGGEGCVWGPKLGSGGRGKSWGMMMPACSDN